MAIIRKNELKKLSEKEMNEKLIELKMELVKAGVTANKTHAKTKELKRTISRILTAMNAKKQIKFNLPQKGKGELKK
jgi:ribosomal protein L29